MGSWSYFVWLIFVISDFLKTLKNALIPLRVCFSVMHFIDQPNMSFYSTSATI